MALSFSDHIVVNPDVMVRTVGDETVLLHLKTELYLGLDPVGTRMWTALTQSPTVQCAFDLFLAEFNVGADELRPDLEEFVGKLLEYQLVEIREGEAPAANQSP